MTKPNEILAKLHKLVMELSPGGEANNAIGELLSKELADLSDQDAIEILAACLTIEAFTAKELYSRLQGLN